MFSLILKREIGALESLWFGSGNRGGNEIAPDHLWHCNNNVRHSPVAKDQERLTIALSWAQIGRQVDGILHFLSSWRLFGNSIHVRLIAAFASKGDRDPSQVRGFRSGRFGDRCCSSCLDRPGANRRPSANPSP